MGGASSGSGWGSVRRPVPILGDLLAVAGDEPRLRALLREQAGVGAVNIAWLTLLSRAVARGEYALRGTPSVPDTVLTEIIDEVFLPLVHGRAGET
jgi:hypothetical protein